jgi:hypothetical protein
MGLESHADRILKDAGINREVYYWRNVLNTIGSSLTRENIALEIMKILDRSKEFGPTRYDKQTGKIEFGTFLDFFEGNSVEYEQYSWNFKSWLVDREGKKMEIQNGL